MEENIRDWKKKIEKERERERERKSEKVEEIKRVMLQRKWKEKMGEREESENRSGM